VSSYSKVLERASAESLRRNQRTTELSEETILAPSMVSLNVPATLPVPEAPFQISRAKSLQALNERVAPLACVGQSVRLLVTGCCPGDGASTVAMALALDMSGRLGLRTLLLDAHLRKPDLHKLLPPTQSKTPPLLLGDQFILQATGLPRLELASCLPTTSEASASAFATLLDSYSLAIVDLGVVRLDGRLLSLARVDDPMVMVVRYGHTERDDLQTTAVALTAASRKVAGVIMNAVPQTPSPANSWPKTFRGDGR